MLLQMRNAERNHYFEQYVQSVDMALRHPETSAKLGDITQRLLSANESAFLPNMNSNGELVVPRRYSDSPDAIPIVPVSEEDAMQSTAIAKPIFDERGPPIKLDGYAISTVSGVTVSTEKMIRWLTGSEPDSDNKGAIPAEAEVTAGLSPRSAARTVVQFALGEDSVGRPHYYYATSRPVIFVRSRQLLGQDSWNQAAVVGHELLHGIDQLENPVLNVTPLGAAGSELAAYHFSSVMYGMTTQPSPCRDYTQTIEQWRKENLHDKPFVPEERHLKTLSEWGVI